MYRVTWAVLLKWEWRISDRIEDKTSNPRQSTLSLSSFLHKCCVYTCWSVLGQDTEPYWPPMGLGSTLYCKALLKNREGAGERCVSAVHFPSINLSGKRRWELLLACTPVEVVLRDGGTLPSAVCVLSVCEDLLFVQVVFWKQWADYRSGCCCVLCRRVPTLLTVEGFW